MSNIPSKAECRKCHGTIYWHKSRAGKNYPTDSPTDRRAFHECKESAPPQSKSFLPIGKNDPTNVEKPITPDYFEATIEQRVTALEKQVSQLSRTIREVESRQPISGKDIGF